MDNWMPKKLPRYVLLIPGAKKAYQNHSADIPNSRSQLLSICSATSTEQCTFFLCIISPGSYMHPTRQGTIILILQIKKCGSERQSNLCEVIQLINGKTTT